MIEIDLVTHLKADTTLDAFVNGRIYPMVAVQNTAKPFITYQIINNKELQSLNNRTPYGERVLIQIDCWADTFSSAVSIRGAVQSAMHSYDKKAHDLRIMSDYESETELHRQLIQFYIKG